jgi:hypothetical protein
VQNVLVGGIAGLLLTTGSTNTLIGYSSGATLTTQSSNTMVGFSSGSGTTSSNNTAIGYESGYNTSTGANNTFVGYRAGGTVGAASGSSTGSGNVVMGYQAWNFSGAANAAANNVIIGQGTASALTGSTNVVIGSAAGAVLSSATNNVIIGSIAGDAINTGTGNTIIGQSALSAGTTATDNIAIGRNAMGTGVALGTGNNVAIGVGAGIAITSGTGNVLIGTGSGNAITTGANNIVIGTATAAAASAGTMRVATAAGDLITASLTTASQNWSPTTTNQADLGTTTSLWRTGFMNNIGVSTTIYSTGTAGTGGLSSTTVTGVGTAWTQAMTNGIIVITSGANINISGSIVSVISATSLLLTTARSIAAGSSYIICYDGLQSTEGVVGANLINLSGTSGTPYTGPEINFRTVLDRYALMQILPYTHDNVNITFDAYFDGSFRSSTTTGGNFMLQKGTGNFNINYANINTPGSVITWTAAQTITNTGVVRFPLSTGITLQTSGGTATALNYYEEFSQVVTASFFTVPPSVTVSVVRVGKAVTVRFSAVTSQAITAGGRPQLGTGGSFPARFSPAVLTPFIISIVSGSTPTLGKIAWDPNGGGVGSGLWFIETFPGFAGLTSNAGWSDINISYYIN